MKKQPLWHKAVLWMIGILAVSICAGLITGGILLYTNGTAAVAAGTAETVFSREKAAGVLRLFLIPTLILADLLIVAAAAGIKVNYKSFPAAGKPDGSVGAYRGPGTMRIWLVLILAAGLITAGILNGGLNDVLIKAINICTECIGLG